MPTVRGFLGFGKFEAYLGFGGGFGWIGFTEHKSTTVDYKDTDENTRKEEIKNVIRNVPSLKAELGISYSLTHYLALGINVNYIYNFDKKGKYCSTSTVDGEAGDEVCQDNNARSFVELLQPGIFIKAYF